MMKTKHLFLILLVVFATSSCVKDQDLFIESGAITSFRFEKSKNPQLSKDIEMEIYPASKRITGYLTENVDISSLVATFQIERGKLKVNNIVQESGKSALNYSQTIQCTCVGDNSKMESFSVTLVPYTGLPVAVIRTEDEKRVQSRDIWMKAHIKVDGMGRMESTTDSATIKGRGNSTWAYPKKAFNLKLNTKLGVLEMPKQKNWTFLANYRDRTLLRNYFTFHLGQIANNIQWTPKSEFVEVIFNGEYQGHYQLCERIKVDKNRVNIKEMTSDDISEETISGGYILEYEKLYDGINKFKTKKNAWPINISEPDENVLNEKQFNYIQDFTNNMEALMASGNFNELYSDYIDIDSFIDYWIVQTLSGNIDIGNPHSVFCYKDRNGKLFAGPLWDFDYSTYVESTGTFNKTTIWYKYLLNDKTFKDKIKERFATLKPQFKAAPNHIATKSQYILNSAKANEKLWPINLTIIGAYQNKDESLSLQEAFDRMVSVYNLRLEWMESEINKL